MKFTLDVVDRVDMLLDHVGNFLLQRRYRLLILELLSRVDVSLVIQSNQSDRTTTVQAFAFLRLVRLFE